jgi:hypothetical protein
MVARKIAIIAGWAWVLGAPGAFATDARQCRGIDFPQHVQLDGAALTLNGLGVRKATFLKINVYVAALYVSKPSSDPDALIGSNAGPQELVLQFVRNVGVDELRKAWREGFERVAKDQLVALEQRIATLNSWMSDVTSGERLQFIREPHSGMQVTVNGMLKGTIAGDDFSRAFISIWLGTVPPNPQLKSGLLGGQCE